MLTCLTATWSFRVSPPDDTERLGMAIDYFQSGKYHEALLIFESLDREYRLNPRFHAYMGVCYYQEWAYEDACKYLDEAIPQLEGFAPHERSVYYFSDAESHFQLQQYQEAIPYYEKALTVCYENEKGEIYYRLGFCYMFAEKWEEARGYYQQALDNYLTYNNDDAHRSRIIQTAHMMKGCENHTKTPVVEIAEKENKDTSLPANTPNPIVELPVDTVVAIPKDSVAETPNWNPIPLVVKQRVTINSPIKRDTISSEVPEEINIDDIYQQQIDIKR